MEVANASRAGFEEDSDERHGARARQKSASAAEGLWQLDDGNDWPAEEGHILEIVDEVATVERVIEPPLVTFKPVIAQQRRMPDSFAERLAIEEGEEAAAAQLSSP